MPVRDGLAPITGRFFGRDRGAVARDAIASNPLRPVEVCGEPTQVLIVGERMACVARRRKLLYDAAARASPAVFPSSGACEVSRPSGAPFEAEPRSARAHGDAIESTIDDHRRSRAPPTQSQNTNMLAGSIRRPRQPSCSSKAPEVLWRRASRLGVLEEPGPRTCAGGMLPASWKVFDRPRNSGRLGHGRA